MIAAKNEFSRHKHECLISTFVYAVGEIEVRCDFSKELHDYVSEVTTSFLTCKFTYGPDNVFVRANSKRLQHILPIYRTTLSFDKDTVTR